MSGTTLIFRLCDEDEEEPLELDRESLAAATNSSSEPGRRNWARWFAANEDDDGDLGEDQPTEAIAGAPEGLWPPERSGDFQQRPSEKDAAVGSDEGGWRYADDELGSNPCQPRDATHPRPSLFPSGRTLAVSAIALVALVLTIAGGTRSERRGPARQQSVATAAASVTGQAPLPASASSSPRGRRRPSPPPTATPVRRARRRQSSLRRRASTTHPPARRTHARIHAPVPMRPLVTASAPAPTPTRPSAPVPAPSALRSESDPAVAQSSPASAGPAEFSFER
jgi:hypothetical protein